MKRDEFFVAWSGLHGGAKIEGVVKTWLQISFALVNILAKLKVSPNFLTFSGLAFAIALWHFPYTLTSL
jgi:archaetidylinositol phosphate synthase